MKLIVKLLCILACGLIGLSVVVPFISASPVDVTISGNWFFPSVLSGAAAYV